MAAKDYVFVTGWRDAYLAKKKITFELEDGGYFILKYKLPKKGGK